MQFKGKGGITYNLNMTPFAQGGEGEIFDIAGMPDKVAKIYKKSVHLGDREQKLNIMTLNPPEKYVLSQIAWPIDLLYKDGVFVGFVMPKLKIAEELNVMYEYGSSAKYPQMPWRSKIIVAKNLCAVLDAVHSAGHVVGDLNPKNISVDPNTGHIVMVDTDSYHIKDGLYRCSVGMPEYLPVEIQQKMKGTNGSLATAPLPTFSKQTDHFALAVHIFQLLMNGVHPFAAAILPTAPSTTFFMPSDNILRGECPFLQKVKDKTIPKFAPPIHILPKEVQTLFERAFIIGHKDSNSRPDAKEWFYVLEKLEKDIKVCQKESFHEYCGFLKGCPWCEADQKFNGMIASSKTTLTQSTISKPAVAAPSYNAKASGAKPSYKTRTQTRGSSFRSFLKPKTKLEFMVLLVFMITVAVLLYITIRMIGIFNEKQAGVRGLDSALGMLKSFVSSVMYIFLFFIGAGFWKTEGLSEAAAKEMIRLNILFYTVIVASIVALAFLNQHKRYFNAKKIIKILLISCVFIFCITLLWWCIYSYVIPILESR